MPFISWPTCANIWMPYKKRRCSDYRTSCLQPQLFRSTWKQLLHRLFVFLPYLGKINKKPHKQDLVKLNEKSYFPHASAPGAKKEKASLFSMSQAKCACVSKCNQVSKLVCLECLFQSRCPLPLITSLFLYLYIPPFSFGLLLWPALPRVPSRCAHTQAGKTGRPHSKRARVCEGKTRLRYSGSVPLHTGCSYRGLFPGGSSPRVCSKSCPPFPTPPHTHTQHTHLRCCCCCGAGRDSPRCPGLIMCAGTALRWLNLLTYLLQWRPRGRRSGALKNGASPSGGHKAAVLFMNLFFYDILATIKW